MTIFCEIIIKHTVKYDYKIKSICDPLVNLLNIPFFTYYQIDATGKFVILSNFAEQCDFYYSEKMYLTNPYLTHPHLMSSGYVLTETTPDAEYLRKLETSLHKFCVGNTFLIAQRNGDVIDCFYFGAQNKHSDYFHHYLNNLELLKKFGRYFIKEAEPLIKRMQSDHYSLLDAKGKAFLERDEKLPLSSKNSKANDFLKAISPLSPREQRCLELFCQGHSAQSTAAKLGLSRRTVEHYFESIKRKLDCHSKWDLLNRG